AYVEYAGMLEKENVAAFAFSHAGLKEAADFACALERPVVQNVITFTEHDNRVRAVFENQDAGEQEGVMELSSTREVGQEDFEVSLNPSYLEQCLRKPSPEG